MIVHIGDANLTLKGIRLTDGPTVTFRHAGVNCIARFDGGYSRSDGYNSSRYVISHQIRKSEECQKISMWNAT